MAGRLSAGRARGAAVARSADEGGRRVAGGGAPDGGEGRRSGRGALADRSASPQGRPAAAGPGFFQTGLAAFRGVTSAERSAWRDGVFAIIEAMTHPQGSAMDVERLCWLARVSRASYYRRWAASAPPREETALPDLVQQLSLAHRPY